VRFCREILTKMGTPLPASSINEMDKRGGNEKGRERLERKGEEEKEGERGRKMNREGFKNTSSCKQTVK